MTKLVLGSALIVLSVGGMMLISFLSFQRIERLLVSIIETKVSQVIQNAQVERELSKVSAETNLLISNFTAQNEEGVSQKGQSLLEILRSHLKERIVTNSEELQTTLQRFIDTLQSLLEQCLEIIRISEAMHEIDTELGEKLDQLEDMVSEKMVVLAMQETNSDTFSLEQLVSMISEYKNFHSQLKIQMIKSQQVNTGLQVVENTGENIIVALLADFKAALGVIAASG
ncbi:MAG: hypothetical protein RBT80_25265, partial [Candidatus Vecturithrix sp.]|nr:hypothetical protein [Candidatus Vecturithrix sp.]